MLMNKYKVGYVVLLIDMIEVIFNIVSIIALIIINLILFGFNTLTKHHTNCWFIYIIIFIIFKLCWE